ncbi:Ribonuclease H-like domain [Trinorchestia longiramus]|nr:Ribonuclease H-like domain [Trinorchestia longiramus]
MCWKTPCATIHYTDGFRNEHGTGFSVVQGDRTVLKKIPRAASSYTREFYAILAAIVAYRFAPTESVTIVYDSRSALQSIHKYNPQHPLCSAIQLSVT